MASGTFQYFTTLFVPTIFQDCVFNFYFFFSSAEIPQYRLPFDVVDFEVDLVRDLGVKIVTGKGLSTDDLTIHVSI